MSTTLNKPEQGTSVNCSFPLIIDSGETSVVIKMSLPNPCKVPGRGIPVPPKSKPKIIDPPKGWSPRLIPVPGKGRNGWQSPPNWQKKVTIDLCDYFTQECLNKNKGGTLTIEVYSPAGFLLVTRTVTIPAAGCDCPNNQ